MRREVIVLEDDLGDGTADETVRFGLDGMNYEIDLNADNAEKLRKVVRQFIPHSRKLGRFTWNPQRSQGTARPASGPTVSQHSIARSHRDQNKAIREWAKGMGYQIGDKGVIPEKYREEFHACGGIVTKKPVKTVPATTISGSSAKKSVKTKQMK
jgi:nucleoid-associated protein Lsr2